MLGSSNKEADKLSHEDIEALDRANKATVAGLFNEVDILKQRMEHLYDKLDKMQRLYGTLLNEFTTFKQQRAIELQSWVNNGPTTPEDRLNGANNRPSTEEGDYTAK